MNGQSGPGVWRPATGSRRKTAYSPVPLAPVIPPELEREYEAYRSHQADAFLRLVPAHGVRPLYGAAREWAKEHGHYDRRSPMTALIAFLKETLPLPPLAIWAEDQARHPVAHLVQGRRSGGDAEESREPLVVRLLETDDETWRIGLHVFADDVTWRGYLSFRPVSSQRRAARKSNGARRSVYRTADIFAEADPHVIHDTFNGYERGTLGAFLRSVLP